MKPTIAYLGLGGMGAAMAARFLDAGYPLTVWNRSPEKTTELVARGAKRAATPKEAVIGADFIFTMVAEDRALNDIALGEFGFVSHMNAVSRRSTNPPARATSRPPFSGAPPPQPRDNYGFVFPAQHRAKRESRRSCSTSGRKSSTSAMTPAAPMSSSSPEIS